MANDKEPKGYLFTDKEIESMLLHGIVINLAYENYGEELLKDAREHLRPLSPDDKRNVISIKILHPERHILDIIHSVENWDLSKS